MRKWLQWGFALFHGKGQEVSVCARLASAHNTESIITDRIVTGPTSVTEKD